MHLFFLLATKRKKQKKASLRDCSRISRAKCSAAKMAPPHPSPHFCDASHLELKPLVIRIAVPTHKTAGPASLRAIV